ncbi:MAG: prolipoprotein diacylglyceryl transferase [Clostridia bacterium]|nr:prolipoprotein diacylglyceryl transferase [Clostridia bacterium]
MDQTVFTLFGLPVTGYALGCMLAMLCGLAVTLPRVLRLGLGWGGFIRLCFCVIPLAWFCSRALYVLADLAVGVIESSYYINTLGNPLPALYFWEGGYSVSGAILGAILGAKIAEKWLHTETGALRDSLCVGLPLAVLIERLCEAGTGLGLGRPVTWAWLAKSGLCPTVEGEAVYPIFFFEALFCLALVVLMEELGQRPIKRTGGDLTRIFLVIYGIGQVLFESFRQDGHMVKHFVHVQQVVAIVFVVAVLVRWSVRMARAPQVRRGMKQSLLLMVWLLTLAGIGVAVWAEFGVDRWGNRLGAYGLMAACLALIATQVCIVRRYAYVRGGERIGTREDPADQ